MLHSAASKQTNKQRRAKCAGDERLLAASNTLQRSASYLPPPRHLQMDSRTDRMIPNPNTNENELKTDSPRRQRWYEQRCVQICKLISIGRRNGKLTAIS